MQVPFYQREKKLSPYLEYLVFITLSSDYNVEDELDLYEKSENARDGMGNSLLRESILGKVFKVATKRFVSYLNYLFLSDFVQKTKIQDTFFSLYMYSFWDITDCKW